MITKFARLEFELFTKPSYLVSKTQLRMGFFILKVFGGFFDE
jgi:hypothetical protein